VVIRDFYLGAWLIKAKGFSYRVFAGKVDVDIDSYKLKKLRDEYASDGHKDFYDCVKKLIREANESRDTSHANH
jgi:hypothetical protein